MKLLDRPRVLCLWALLGGLVAGCAAALCQPGESTVSCCIKKFPLSPIESCAATEVEVLETLGGLLMAYEAAKGAGEEDEFANNAHLPEWKQQCIKNYVDCKNKAWIGNCYACLRYCEGQQAWPDDMCHERD